MNMLRILPGCLTASSDLFIDEGQSLRENHA